MLIRLRKLIGASFRRGDFYLLTAIILVAFAVRLFFLWDAAQVPLTYNLVSDAKSYFDWAQSIADGDLWGRKIGTFYQAPLYPYFLSVQLALGGNVWTILFVQIILGSIGCGFVFLAARRLFSPSVGCVAGLIVALYAPAVFLDATIQKESLGQFWMALLLYFLACNCRTPRIGTCLGVGIVLGFLSLVRENCLLFAPVIACGLAVLSSSPSYRHRCSWVVAFVLGILLVLLPVGARNLAIGGNFSLTTSQAGPNFFIGNSPGATGSYLALQQGKGDPKFERLGATQLAEQANGRRMNPGEVSSYWFDQAFAYIASNPLDWLHLIGTKLLLVVNRFEIPDTVDIYLYADYSWILRLLGWITHFGVLFPLAAGGIVLTWAKRRDLWILYVLAAATTFGLIVFYIVARYRFPLVPILGIFAAAAIIHVTDAWRTRAWRTLGLTAAVSLGALLAANWPLDRHLTNRCLSYNNLGLALQSDQRFEEADRQYRRALDLCPNLFEAHFNLARNLVAQDRLEEARQRLVLAAQQAPDHESVQNLLGVVALQSGHIQEAIIYFKEAMRLRPYYPQAINNLSIALRRNQQWDQAIVHLKTSLAKWPDDMSIQLHLIRTIVANPKHSRNDLTQAIAMLERISAVPNLSNGILQVAQTYLQAGIAVLAAESENTGHNRDQAIYLFRKAIQMAPDHPHAYNRLAWILATRPDVAHRQPEQAIRLAERACKLSNYGVAAFLDTLSAAHASSGQFDLALSIAKQAVVITEADGNEQLAKRLQKRIDLYRQGISEF